MITSTQKLLFFSICILPSIFAHHPTNCNRSCGLGQLKPVPFPFGFSSGCPIQLNCTPNGTVSIDRFTVQSFTPDTILINLPAQCGRPIKTLRRLFSRHYAPTSQNGILLENCSKPITTCKIPDTAVQTHFELLECGSKGNKNSSSSNNNVSCYSEENKRTEFIDYFGVMSSGCESLFSAISAVETSAGSGLPAVTSLEVEVVQLGWWLEGGCECSENANCTRVLSPVDGRRGYRCRCGDGFVGDGYRAGLGCRKGLFLNVEVYLSQYHQNFQLSNKSDVYSFGVVLVEIITALKVVDFSRTQNEVNLASLAMDRIVKGRLDEIIDPLIKAESDSWTLSSVHQVSELAFRCLSYDRGMRPSMTEVALVLEHIRLSGCASVEENTMALYKTSTCSSSSNLSEKTLGVTFKKPELDTRGLFVTEVGVIDSISTADFSPISVQDPWLSEQSSPSSNSLLHNVVQ
ncbi:hypothetical protein RHGRI_016151 [Rhododendron griersonianum]|uniref:Uncharacterized protein n=1 Tax=Rhododendron griersonianum TaxID=479676 RepID=A0AAV6JRA4_9ERIC|nr:hypothetical protein RHGRI_016151 [Rhododendron griersonianum]